MFQRTLGLAILPLYFLGTILVGWWARRGNGSANAYLNASRSLPLPVVVSAYLAANCGALETVGLSAMAAQYGAQAFHFYGAGAIPAMIFLALWMMPVYRRSGVQSVPEYLQQRYGPSVRLLNACVMALTTLLLAGISLYAMAQVLEVVLGLQFAGSVLLSGAVVLLYVVLGGVRATIYNEVFQLAVMLAGLTPLAVLGARATAHAGGLGLMRRPAPGLELGLEQRLHAWKGLPVFNAHAPMDLFGIVVGLGFVLSFGYWCTDFVQMQRALAARTEAEARQVPLWAGFGKLLFSLIVVLPGLAAARLFPQLGQTQRFDQALPALMKMLYGPAMLGLGLTALAASLMSGLAANVSAFAALWTEDIYRATRTRLGIEAPETHYFAMGRWSAVAAIGLSAVSSYLNFFFSNLMEHVQLIFSVLGAPFWAIFLLGVGTRRTTARGAIAGFVSGAAFAILHLLASMRGWIRYGSTMTANFHGAFYAFAVALLVGWAVSVHEGHLPAEWPSGLVFDWRAGLTGERIGLLWSLSGLLLLAFLWFSIHWR